jgi:diguanylate cyclase (GGDEF)-like protein
MHTLKRQFLYWILMIILALGVLINTAFYWIYSGETERTVQNELNEKLNLQSQFIDRWLEERAANVRHIAGDEDVRSLNKAQMLIHFQNFINHQRDFDDLAFVNKEGDFEVVAKNPLLKASAADKEYYRNAVKGIESISEVNFEKNTGEPFIVFSAPAYNKQNEFTGFIFGKVKLITIHRTLQSVQFGRSGEQYLIDRQGVLITEAHTSGQLLCGIGKIETEILQRALTGSDNDSTVYTNYRGDRVLGAYKWTKNQRWIVVAEIKSGEVFASMYETMVIFVLITITILVISLFGVFMVTRRIQRPLEFLLQGTKVMKEGHFDYRIDPSVFRRAPIELRELCDTYNSMGAKLKSTVRLLEEYAMIDALTELHNRRYLMQEGEKRLESSLLMNEPCTLMMIDADHFKKINDTHGHQVGDRVLRHIGDILNRLAGERGLLARYGGEEFMILIQRMNLEESRRMAETIRSTVEKLPYADQSVTIPLTVSVGIASIEAGQDTSAEAPSLLNDLAEAADRALYKAKQKGRNRVESED